MVPLLVLLPHLTGSGVWGALVLAVDTGIVALLLPYTGHDRRPVRPPEDHDRRERRGPGSACCCCSACAAPERPGWRWSAIGVVAVAKAFYSPAAQAALPNVLDPDELAAGNAVAGSAWGTMTVVGASLGGVLSAAVGPYACFWVAAVGLVLAAGLATLIRRPLQAPRDAEPAGQRTWPAIREALRLHRAPAAGARAGHREVGGRPGQRRADRVPAARRRVRRRPGRHRPALRGPRGGGAGRADPDAPGADQPGLAAARAGAVHVPLRPGLPGHVGGALVPAGAGCWSSWPTSRAAATG